MECATGVMPELTREDFKVGETVFLAASNMGNMMCKVINTHFAMGCVEVTILGLSGSFAFFPNDLVKKNRMAHILTDSRL